MTDLHTDFETLLGLLDMQMNVNRRLLALAEEQRHSIIKNEVEKLDGLVRRQAGELKQLSALEKKRLTAVTQMRSALNLQDQPFTLSSLLPYAPKEQQQTLQSLLTEFTALLNELKEANDTNKLLLQTNIELNELMLNLLADNVDPLNNIYGEDGRAAEDGPAGPSLFDHQI